MDTELIFRYFPTLDEPKREKFRQLGSLYEYWNSRINLVSRKDMENLHERHILHSLAIAKVFSFMPGTRIMDAGTGGGFPGIPLAIMFPDCPFLLVDATAKKLVAVTSMADELGLENVEVRHRRLEEVEEEVDFVVGRALSNLPQTVKWVMKNISRVNRNDMANGLLYLKGGDFQDELALISFKKKIYDLSNLFEEEFFQTKKMVHIFK
jgi:16S rRNA (guanine527-N7)-methyltransferase